MDARKGVNLDKEPVSTVERARRYLAKVPPSISGSGGHTAAFHAACVLAVGFALDECDATALMSEWNQGCTPPWTPKELKHKLDQAFKARSNPPAGKAVGYLLGDRKDYSPTRPVLRRGASSSSVSRVAGKPSHDARDAVLTAPIRRNPVVAAVGVETIPAAAFAAMRAVVSKPVEVADSAAKSVAKGVEVEADSVARCYGSRAVFDGAVKAALEAAGSRWVTKEMRWPNVLRVDDRVLGSLPEILDGMILQAGARGRVSLVPVLEVSIMAGHVQRRADDY